MAKISKTRITISINDWLLECVDALAEKRGLSRTVMISLLLEGALAASDQKDDMKG